MMDARASEFLIPNSFLVIRSAGPLSAFEQLRLQGLILSIADGTGVPCLLEVDKLLAERCVWALGVAIPNGDAAVEQEQGWKCECSVQERRGSFHGWRSCPGMDGG